MFKRLTIFQRLVISYLALGWLMLIIVSFIFYQAFKEALLTRTLEQLSSINMLKRIQIEEYFHQKDNIDIHDPHIKFILREITGIGQTGESYLVDSTLHMRSESRFFPGKTPEEIEVVTPSALRVFEIGESKMLCPDYRQVPVLSVGRMIEHYNHKDLAILTEIDESEAMKPVYEVRNYIIVIVLVCTILIFFITLILAGKLSRPILTLKRLIESLALGKIPPTPDTSFEFTELEEIHQALLKLKDEFINTSQFAHETGSGNFNASFEPLSEEDVLGHALILMRNRLKELTEQQLSAQRQRSSALLEGQEKERERISRELHDGLGQLLTGIKLILESESIQFDRKTEIKELLSETIQEVRRISQSAMPPTLAGLGLEAALNSLCKIMSSRETLEIDMEYELAEGHPKDFESRICLYRIAQEALNNMAKYSNASRCLIHVYEAEGFIVMKISDNGQGFDKANQLYSGNGLRNMKERAAMLEGSCKIQSDIGKGTHVVVEIPLLK